LNQTATIAQTNQIVKHVESTIKKLSPASDEDGNAIERLRTMRSLTGQGGARWSLTVSPLPPQSNIAEVLIRTTDRKWTESMIRDLREAVDVGNPLHRSLALRDRRRNLPNSTCPNDRRKRDHGGSVLTADIHSFNPHAARGLHLACAQSRTRLGQSSSCWMD
jgi:hypothetical protein